MSKLIKRFVRQLPDPNSDVVSVNERCSVQIVQDRAVILKDGLRIIGYYDKWPEMDKLTYIRDGFKGVLLDPLNAPDPDWSLLAA